jgi:hypothetical protein
VDRCFIDEFHTVYLAALAYGIEKNSPWRRGKSSRQKQKSPVAKETGLRTNYLVNLIRQ